MLELKDLTTQYIETVEATIESADRLLWHITFAEGNGRWAVYAGDQALLVTDSKEVADAFVYGMGLAYSIISEDVTTAYLESLGLGQEFEDFMLHKRQRKDEGDK